MRQIFVRPYTSDGAPRALTSPHDFVGCPRFSPDGRFIAYLAYGPRVAVGEATWFASNVVLMDESGARSWRLTEGAAMCSCPAWSPDGWLYVACDATGKSTGVDEAGGSQSDVYRMRATPLHAEARREGAGLPRASRATGADANYFGNRGAFASVSSTVCPSVAASATESSDPVTSNP